MMTAEKERAKNKKLYTIHETDIILNKDKLDEALEGRGIDYLTFHSRLVDTYGLDLSYKGFNSLIKNRPAWKLIYAWSIADMLKMQITDLFEPVKIDVQAKIKEKEEWNAKYGNKRKKG